MEKFRLLPEKQSRSLGIFQEHPVARPGQAVVLVLPDPDDIVVKAHFITVVSHQIPGNGFRQELFPRKLRIEVLPVNLRVEHEGPLSVHLVIAIQSGSVQVAPRE